MLFNFVKNLVKRNVRISNTERIALNTGSTDKPTKNIENSLLRGLRLDSIIDDLRDFLRETNERFISERPLVEGGEV